jgi:hypothetical protein
VFSFGNATFTGLYINEVGTYILRIYVLGTAEVSARCSPSPTWPFTHMARPW